MKMPWYDGSEICPAGFLGGVASNFELSASKFRWDVSLLSIPLSGSGYERLLLSCGYMVNRSIVRRFNSPDQDQSLWAGLKKLAAFPEEAPGLMPLSPHLTSILYYIYAQRGHIDNA